MQIVLFAMSLLTGLFGLYFLVIAALGAFRKPLIQPEAPPAHRLAALIAARNEAEVIGPLVESLMAQNYPRERFDVIVVPNNCDDDTAGEAERAGAIVLPCAVPVRSKGEVLKFAFDELLPEERYDAFVIFDADNLVDPGFFQSVNNSLTNGYRIAQGYRDSKNADDNWIAGCVSIFYWFMSRLYNRARNRIGMSAALNGTGFMVSASLLKEIDYRFTTLTEDLELSAICALHGEAIGWMQDAITYDEQPTQFAASYTQRRRWFAGTFQCLKKFGAPLYKAAWRRDSLQCADMTVVFFGTIVQLVGVLIPAILVVQYAVRALIDPAAWIDFLEFAIYGLALGQLLTAGFAALICLLEGKLNRRRLGAILLFPTFMVTWMIANVTCLFSRAPQWKQIRHGGRQSAKRNTLPM